MNVTSQAGARANGAALCRVTYRMTDQMGMVYYGHYLEFFEMGRVELMRAAGLSYRRMEEAGYRLPVVHAWCDYLTPGRYDDLLEIETRVLKLTRAQIHFGYEIRRRDEARLLARGETRHAFLAADGRPVRLDPAWFERLSRLRPPQEAAPR